MSARAVVVTAVGMLSPVGGTARDSFEALLAGACGIRRAPDASIRRSVGYVTQDVTAGLHPSQARMLDRVTLLAHQAAVQAIDAADLDPVRQAECGVFVGTGIGGVGTLCEAVETYHGLLPKRPVLVIPAVMPQALPAHIAQRLQSTAEAQTYATACSAGAVAIGEAYRRIRDGYLDVAIAGGAESMFSPMLMAAWGQLHVLCAEPTADQAGYCRPFSDKRTGFALAEGAAMLVLESAEHARARNATVIAELCGYGVSNDGTHPIRPDARGQALAMARCLGDARAVPTDVQYINAHATGTLAGDRIETQAIKQLFGAHAHRLAISSIKGAVGHAIGAAGAIEAVVTAMAVQQGRVPPTLFFARGDPQCDLDYVGEGARSMPGLRLALSNSFGMGGNNAVLAFRKAGNAEATLQAEAFAQPADTVIAPEQ